MVALGEWNSLDPNLQNLEVEGFFCCLFVSLVGCVLFFFLIAVRSEIYRVNTK